MNTSAPAPQVAPPPPQVTAPPPAPAPEITPPKTRSAIPGIAAGAALMALAALGQIQWTTIQAQTREELEAAHSILDEATSSPHPPAHWKEFKETHSLCGPEIELLYTAPFIGRIAPITLEKAELWKEYLPGTFVNGVRELKKNAEGNFYISMDCRLGSVQLSLNTFLEEIR